jgi:predicted RNA methylase
MTQTTIEGAGTQKRELSQFFTPADLAERIVTWALVPYAGSYRNLEILEPSAGRGALVKPLLRQRFDVTAIEIDPDNVSALKLLTDKVLCTDFLTVDPENAGGYDLAIMNPPFEGGQTERHILHALRFADRVVCHCPLTTLEGKARRSSLWSKVRLNQLAICASRPKYGADGGKTAMCTIDVELVQNRQDGDEPCEWRDVTVEVWP